MNGIIVSYRETSTEIQNIEEIILLRTMKERSRNQVNIKSQVLFNQLTLIFFMHHLYIFFYSLYCVNYKTISFTIAKN